MENACGERKRSIPQLHILDSEESQELTMLEMKLESLHVVYKYR